MIHQNFINISIKWRDIKSPKKNHFVFQKTLWVESLNIKLFISMKACIIIKLNGRTWFKCLSGIWWGFIAVLYIHFLWMFVSSFSSFFISILCVDFPLNIFLYSLLVYIDFWLFIFAHVGSSKSLLSRFPVFMFGFLLFTTHLKLSIVTLEQTTSALFHLIVQTNMYFFIDTGIVDNKSFFS